MNRRSTIHGDSRPGKRRAVQPVFPMAVIELGTSAIRMAIGETDGVSGVRMLEQLVRGVSLGKDAFTLREIQRDTVLQAVDVLKSYRRKLEEYQCTNPNHIRVVATSAVREAANRMAFLDQIYTSTGLVVEPIDDAEIARVTYLGIRPQLERDAHLRDALTLLMEVGGGKTEILLLRGRDILHSQSYKLGSLRLQQLIRQYHADSDQAVSIINGQIDRTLEQLRDFVPQHGDIELLALGGDVRFAVRALQLEVPEVEMVRVPLRKLQRFTREISRLNVEQIMRKHHLELSEAETLVPALFANVRMAEMLGTDHLLVTGFNLRDALLHGMLQSGEWSSDFREQIIRSAEELARRFHVDLDHGQHVSELARQIFHATQAEHKLDARSETILCVGALLHEAGQFVSDSGYHKHSHYLISHSKIFGLNSLDHKLTALVARYHRRAAPKASHAAFADLDRDSRVVLCRLAGILRIAICLAQSRTRRIPSVQCTIERNRLIIHTTAPIGDLSMEQLELRQNSVLFQDVFGMSVLLRDNKL
ncbi:MAG: exopolyphosphatase [Fuerstiella sp.]|nr:exopolyphosphatase [Fuerstiella sp.]MCP4509471.1 exopolyphosphatase [Fuerstiella sp.]MDG2129265.1 exopolyphosphatase [Fuerstiella sp.]